MRFFFRSRQFKILLSILLVLIAVSVTCIIIGGKISPQANIFGTITAPFSALATKVSHIFEDFVSTYKDGNEIMIKNSELENELNEMREALTDYEKIRAENEFYKNYLEIKDNNPDFVFCPSFVISKDTKDPYKSFVINKGSTSGIEQYDPVITDAGLVGFVSEVGLSTSKVSTILSPDVKLGAIDNRTSDAGVLCGSLELASQNRTGLNNLSRSCNVATGDYIITSGEGIFPEGLLIGTIHSIGSDEYNTSIFAEVAPFADFENLREVMVITDFEGQGGLLPSQVE